MALYRKKGSQELNPWTSQTKMEGVSVSESDKEGGSPKEGDMIAVNSKDKNDKWLVSAEFFNVNYELA